jgi:hypothetical protein
VIDPRVSAVARPGSQDLLREERTAIRLSVAILEERSRTQDPVRISPEFAKLCARYLARLLEDG